MKKTISLINDYYDFLDKQETQRKEFINKLSIDIVDKTTKYFESKGWGRVGKGGGLVSKDYQPYVIDRLMYKKDINGQECKIRVCLNLKEEYSNDGYCMIHTDKPISDPVRHKSILFSSERSRWVFTEDQLEDLEKLFLKQTKKKK